MASKAEERLTRKVTAEEFEALMDSTDLHALNEAALVFGGEAGEATKAAALMEGGRKRLLLEIRDDLMQKKGLAATRAEEEAKATQEYIDYLAEIAILTGNAEAWRAASRFLFTRVRILMAEKAEPNA